MSVIFLSGEKTLKDVLPREFLDFRESRAFAMRNVGVKEEIDDRPWIGSAKNVHVWWILENGYAVAWNENISRGWSFPVAKMNKLNS